MCPSRASASLLAILQPQEPPWVCPSAGNIHPEEEVVRSGGEGLFSGYHPPSTGYMQFGRRMTHNVPLGFHFSRTVASAKLVCTTHSNLGISKPHPGSLPTRASSRAPCPVPREMPGGPRRGHQLQRLEMRSLNGQGRGDIWNEPKARCL